MCWNAMHIAQPGTGSGLYVSQLRLQLLCTDDDRDDNEHGSSKAAS
jgi:hypothetical protein